MNIEFWIGVLSTLVVGLVSIIVTLILSKRATENQNQIQTLISKITGLFSVSQRVGIETAYENREIALSPYPYGEIKQNPVSFVSRFEREKKLIVVGSSILGLRMYVEHLPTILSSRAKRGYETKFMLTHPCFSRFREKQEGRYEGQICKEIEETVRYLKDCGLDVGRSIRFYRGTPTCFVIITSVAMLLNPYPYQIEAFRSFCIEVRRMPQQKVAGAEVVKKKGEDTIPPQIDDERFRKDFTAYMRSESEREYDYRMNIGQDIYGQFYWCHYLLPWFSPQSVTYNEFVTSCQNCDGLNAGYDAAICKLRTQTLNEVTENKS